MILTSAAMVIFGVSIGFYLSVGMIFILNLTIPIMNSHSQAIWQTQTPHELQGRVFAVRRLIAQFSWPLSTAMAGWLGGRFNPGTVIAVLGGLLIIFCVAQLFNPVLLRVEDKAYLDGMAAKAANGD
jgi:DHA3 family macrolide efflux protein-like MFS transporter